MTGHDTLRFDTEAIAALARQTRGHQQEWDAIWTRVRSQLSATAAEALSREPGRSLEQRTADYHRRTQRYHQQLSAQAVAVHRVGAVAEDCNGVMTRVIAGSS